MASSVSEVIRLVYELSVVDKGTKKLLDSERQVQRETKQTARAMAQQDTAVKRSANVAEQASRRQVAATRKVTAAQKRAEAGLLKRGAGSAAGAGRHAVGLVAGIATVASAEKAVSVTEQLAKTTLTLHKSFGIAVKDASRWAAVSQARGADGKQMTMGFKALATQVRNATQADGKHTKQLDDLRAKNAVRIQQAEEDASRMKDQDAARRKLTRVQVAAARAEADLSKKTGSQLELFQQLGISQQQLVKHGNDMNWVLRAVSDGLAGMPTGTDKAAISAKLFGRTWTTIAPLVRDGSKALEEQLHMADKYGATMGGDTVAELQKHIKAEREAKLAALGLQVAFGTKVAPTLTHIIEKTSEFAAQMHSGAGAGGRFAKQAREIADDLTPVWNALKTTGKYLAEHPRLVVAAAAAYASFKAVRGTVKIAHDIQDIGSSIASVARRASKTKLATLLADGARGTASRIRRALSPVGDVVEETMSDAASRGATAMSAPGKWRKAGRIAGRSFGIAAAAVAIYEISNTLNKGGINETGSKDYGSGIVGSVLRGLSKIGNAPINLGGKVLGIQPKRRGGLVGRYGSGGMVPIAAAGGEVMVHGGGATMIGGDPGRDGTMVMAPVGAAILTHDGQARMAMGASLSQAIATQAPHFAKGGRVRAGRYESTAYGPPWGGIQGGGTTATGVNLRRSPHVYGVAVDPSVIPLGSQVYAWPNPFGRSGSFRAFDTGGAIKGNRIDFYDWRGRKRQNAWGRKTVRVSAARLHGDTPQAATDEEITARIPLSLNPSKVRAGLLQDAVEQGIAAGAAGLRRKEIARAAAGGRGARRNPILESIAGALTPTTREVTLPGQDSDSGGSVSGPLPGGVTVPRAAWNPAKRPIAKWIVPYLQWAASPSRGSSSSTGPARRGGGGRWAGTVTSGFRSLAEQKRIWNSGVRPAARPGSSNHEGSTYPRGAVDVTQASMLAQVLRGKPGPHLLQFAGAKDPVHFSHPHGGSYRRGGVVGHNATYYRSRFGDRYRGFYLWAKYGKGRGLGRNPGSGEWYGALGDYAGDWRNVPDQRAWRDKWSGGQRFAKGGIVGGRLGSTLAGAMTFKGGSFDALDTAIGGAVESRLDLLRAEVLKRVRRGGDKKTVQRLQSVIDLIDFELGRRIGRYQDIVERRSARLERAQGAADRSLRLAGVDPGSIAGVAMSARGQAAETKVRAQNVASLTRALAVARRTGNQEVIRDAVDKLNEARDAVAESLVRQVELWRDQLRAITDEVTARAQFRTGLAGAGGSILEAWQRTAGVQDTAQSMVQRAQYTTGVTLPALEQQRTAAVFAAQIAAATGDVNGWRSAVQDAASAAVDIANAQADAADLIRAAANRAAQDLVDAATHGKTMADLGLERLDLEQQLIGTHDTTGGAIGRADFIKASIIPAIQGEITALVVQLATAQATGDQALATQIGEAIYAKQNDVLKQQVDALNEIKANTDPLKEFGGSQAFSYQSQTFTDLDAIRARVGA